MKKLKKVALLIIVLIMALATMVNAAELTITTKAAKSEMKVGDTTTVTVEWGEKMQAADFVLNYDNTKLELVEASISSSSYTDSNGKIIVVWYSGGADAEQKEEIEFTFKGKAEGKAEISLEVKGGFATGNLVVPDGYNTENADTTITLIGATQEDDGGNNGGTSGGNTDSGNSNNGGTTTGGQDTNKDENKNNGTTAGSTENKNNNATTTTNPTSKPTTLPKAGKAQMFIIFAVVIGMIAFSSYQLKKYKGI